MTPTGGVHLHPVETAGAPDRVRAEAAVADLLSALGRGPDTAHTAQTPRRVVDALLEMLEPREFTMTTFANDEGYSDLVLVRDIPFTSLCAHHLLPFRGVAHVGYVPRDRIVGLSKLARVVEWYASDLQLQERLTLSVAEHLERHLAPAGLGVVVRAEHLCMSVRGVRASGATTETHVFSGVVRTDDRLRRRFEASGM
jgi:GTP cyclohydrolase I